MTDVAIFPAKYGIANWLIYQVAADVTPTRIEYVIEDVDAGVSTILITAGIGWFAADTKVPITPIHVVFLKINAINVLDAVPETKVNEPTMLIALVFVDGIILFDHICVPFDVVGVLLFNVMVVVPDAAGTIA